MGWCYGDAVFNDPRRELQLTFEEYFENLLQREQLEYDVYDGENYEAEHYGPDHWPLRTDVDQILARYRASGQKQEPSPFFPCTERVPPDGKRRPRQTACQHSRSSRCQKTSFEYGAAALATRSAA